MLLQVTLKNQNSKDTGFYKMIEIGRLQLDWSLAMALIERWRAQTHTLHLSIGEATVTLQDMEVLYGLPIALPPGMRKMTLVQYLDMLQRLTAFWPEDENVLYGTSHFLLMTIRLWLEALHPQIDGDTPDYHVERYTRLLLLLLFGGVLFSNTSRNLVSLRFIHHLERVDDLPQYSWALLFSPTCTGICVGRSWEPNVRLLDSCRYYRFGSGSDFCSCSHLYHH